MLIWGRRCSTPLKRLLNFNNYKENDEILLIIKLSQDFNAAMNSYTVPQYFCTKDVHYNISNSTYKLVAMKY